jgi:hypothetical protein
MVHANLTRSDAGARSVSKQFYSETELSLVSGIAVKTLRNWRLLQKGIPFYRFGGSVKYSVQEFERWAEAQRCGGERAH